MNKYKSYYSKKTQKLCMVNEDTKKLVFTLPCKSYRQYVYFCAVLKDYVNQVKLEVK